MPNMPNQVVVTYNADAAEGEDPFSYTSNWETPGNNFLCQPGVTHVNFILNTTGNGSTAAAIFASPPFIWPGGQPVYIKDIEVEGNWAGFVDSYSEEWGGIGSFPFQIQITYNNQTIQSNDPTIVNVGPNGQDAGSLPGSESGERC